MFAKIFLTGIAVAALAVAQSQPGGGGGGGGGRGGGGDPNMGVGGFGRASYHKETQADQIANRLKLDNDQKMEVNTILEATMKDAAPIIQQVRKSRQDLANALLNGKSEADVAPLNEALRAAQFQMTGVEVKAFQKIVALLKPNQMSKVPEAFDLMADIFVRPGSGPGGPGARGGR
jgi:hypothetical protein